MIAKDTIVVAMSGGVDSSVAALLLKQQNQAVVGISMQVWDYRKNGGCESKATCCSPDDFTDARTVAASIGVPYYVFDFEKVFEQEVINRFVETYKRGLTPNPCVDCNSRVKFSELRKRAESLGCAAVATGHYAQVEKSAAGYHLLRGVDSKKDQSYFLYGLTQAELSRTIFPVGHLHKTEVRELARAAGLSTASKAESQDICFISGSVQDFLVRIGGQQPSGKIVDRSGIVLGEHEGIHAFTVGQRKGIRVAANGSNTQPLYVSEIRPDTLEVVVGGKSDLERSGFTVGQLNWLAPQILSQLQTYDQPEIKCLVQVRHRHAGVPVKFTLNSSEVKVHFENEWCVVSPGQAAVFYDLENREVLGGGRIGESF